MSPLRARLLALVPVAALFLTACALPALRLADGTVWSGAQLLLTGMMGILLGQFAWLANVLWLAAIICLLAGSPRAGALLTLAAATTALHMLAVPGMEIPLDEGGVNKTHAAALAVGAWVWLAAMAAPAIVLLLPKAPR